MNYSYKLEFITKDDAERYLDDGINPRAIKDNEVKQLLFKMNSGEFEPYNGQTICFDENNRLVDGQHRLTAFIESNLDVLPMMVIRGAKKTLTTVDLGSTRTVGDLLKGQQVPYAAVAASLSLWRSTYYSDGRRLAARSSVNSNFNYAINIPAIRRDEICRIAQDVKCGTVCGQIALLLLLGYENGYIREVNEFCQSLRDGVNLSKDSPIYRLREKLSTTKLSKGRLHGEVKFRLLIKAWNLFITGQKCEKLHVPTIAPDRFVTFNFPVR